MPHNSDCAGGYKSILEGEACLSVTQQAPTQHVSVPHNTDCSGGYQSIMKCWCQSIIEEAACLNATTLTVQVDNGRSSMSQCHTTVTVQVGASL